MAADRLIRAVDKRKCSELTEMTLSRMLSLIPRIVFAVMLQINLRSLSKGLENKTQALSPVMAVALYQCGSLTVPS